MERLTVNKPVSEMNMVELAHNCCYISEDGNARYRDYKSDIDAREFTRRLMRIYNDENLSEGDTELDEEIMTELKYDPEIYPSALIALFYRNMWAMAELRSRLKYYEDAEEQGLLLRLQLKVGDTVIWDDNCGNPKRYTITGYSFGEAEDYIDEPVVTDEIVYYCTNSSGSIIGSFASSEIGKTVFLTKEEAEQKLASMQKGE